MRLLFFVINKQKNHKNSNQLNINTLQKTKCFAMLFFNMLKIVIITNILNVLFIENQLIDNNVITKQLH
jgi:hypothetical protein